MILVVNLNAAIDKRYRLENLSKHQVNRIKSVENRAGGKGINVASVCHALGEEVLVVGFAGGYNGLYIERELQARNIPHRLTRCREETRCCLNIIDDDGGQTEILEPGPIIQEEEQVAFLNSFAELVPQADLIVASGSLPRNLPGDFYARLLKMSMKKKFFLDSSGAAMQRGFEQKPYLIKPNQNEVQKLAQREIKTLVDGKELLLKWRAEGIACPLISLGDKGALFVDNDERVWQAVPPAINPRNTVGSGDSFVAGMAVGLKRGYQRREQVALAISCGTSNALLDATGAIEISTVKKIKGEVRFRELV